jgi:DNA end-binding protein Ku
MKSIWKGTISFGLVSIPIKVYTATQTKELQFKTLDKEGHPVEYKRWCPICKREIEWREVKKGYKVSKDRYVVLEKSDFEKVKLRTTKAIEIEEFVDAPQIDPIFIEKSYYVVPDEAGLKAYSLFTEALSLSNKIAIGKVVIRNKEYLVALRAFKKGLVMHILHYLSEIRPIEQIPELKELVVVKDNELKLAQALIQKLTSREFDPSKFRDTYSEALKKIIKAKALGQTIEVVKEAEVEEAKSLMEALKASVESLEKKKVKVK